MANLKSTLRLSTRRRFSSGLTDDALPPAGPGG
jgi:hypothetical protein